MGYTCALEVLDHEVWTYWREEAIRLEASASQQLLALLEASKRHP
jgi:hypothetical protein